MKKYFVSFVMSAPGSFSAHHSFSNAIVEFEDIKTPEDLEKFQYALSLRERKKQPSKQITSLHILYYKEV